MSRERSTNVEAVGNSEAKSRQAASETTGGPVGESHGYIKAKDKERLQNRLRRIEGQVRGLQRMVDEETYCVDVLTQVASVVSALEKVGALVLKDHVEHCLRESIESGDRQKADEKVEELTAAVERFLRV